MRMMAKSAPSHTTHMRRMYIHIFLFFVYVCLVSHIHSELVQLLATGSGDTSVKLWDLSNNQPSWIATHNPNIVRAKVMINKYSYVVGICVLCFFAHQFSWIVFSVSFSAESPFLLAIGGSEGELKVWETLLDSSVSRRYGTTL
ncbi:unnamed protein product [Cochlearia groenlandica]